MAKCCGNGGQAIIEAKQRIGLLPSDQKGDNMKTVRLEFTGSQAGTLTFTANGKQYKGGNNPIHRFVDARPEDVDRLVSLGVFRVVRPTEQEIKPVEDDQPKSLLEEEPEKKIAIVEEDHRDLVDAMRYAFENTDDEPIETTAILAERELQRSGYEPEAQVITLADGVDEKEATTAEKALNAHKRGRKAKA